MELSPKLAAKFEQLQTRYPVKRSALIPMMMYAQDEYGYITDEMVAEIAGRLGLQTVQVEETLAFYSMLRRKPMGKHHVQVCTNVACMLRGGTQLLEHAKKRLEIGHKETTPDGVFSLEEVECIGACTGRACCSSELRFLRKRYAAKFRSHYRGTRQGPTPNSRAGDYRRASRAQQAGNAFDQQALGHQGLFQDRRVSPKRRLSGAGKSSEADDAGFDHRRSKEIQPARAWRRGFPNRNEVVVSSPRIHLRRSMSSATPTNPSLAPVKIVH